MAATSLNAVLIDSRDPARLAAFYRERIGVPIAEERHGPHLHYGCDLAGLHFAIHGSQAASSSSPIAISFAVQDVDALVADLRRAGVAIAQEPVDRPFGRLAAVRDPDGNLVYLHRPPTR